MTEGALSFFQRYHWPGNVRELKNLLESLLVSTSGDVVDVLDLPTALRSDGLGHLSHAGPALPVTMEEMERELIRRTLDHTAGNRTRAALILRIGVRTLQRKISRYNLT